MSFAHLLRAHPQPSASRPIDDIDTYWTCGGKSGSAEHARALDRRVPDTVACGALRR